MQPPSVAAPRVIRRRSQPSAQGSARILAAYSQNPAAEAEWQAAMSELPAIVLQWAAGELDKCVLLACQIPKLTVTSGADLREGAERELEADTEAAGSMRAAILEQRVMEESVLREQELERERTWENVVALAVEGMHEGERRDWLTEQHRQDERHNALWQRHNTFVDYSTTERTYVESERMPPLEEID
ncbi:hypothetical protein B0H10DRAFT_1967617 [Mycena sp. CBHHK59/15]|nr:hypothetical protein B0H10DRAFT_1967617 [Mycena sp. CBHHK59/15]